MQTVEKSALQTELEASAIAPDLAKNFIPVKGRDEAIPEVDELAWDYLFYLQVYRRNGGGLRQHWLKNYAHIDAGGWWCSTLDILNCERSHWGCFKPNTPRKNKEGKIVKYEHPPKEPTQPFFLELTRERWVSISAKHGAEFVDLIDIPESATPFEFWEWVKNTPELPIIITEGAKKTASLLSASYCAVGLSGIWNGAPAELAGDGTKLEKKLNPQLQAIATPGREIIFCFDNDEKPKTLAAVTKATQTLAELFEAEGCNTSVMSWLGTYKEKGIDDVHAAYGQGAIDQLFVARRSLDDWVATMNKPMLKSPDLAPAPTSQPGKVEAVTSTPLAPPSEYNPALEPEENTDTEVEKDPALTYQEIALQWIYGKGHYISIEVSAQKMDLFKFNGKFYEKLKPSLERKKIKAWAEQYWVKDPRSGRKRLKYLTTSCINEIYKYALMSFEVDKADCEPEGFNFDNGILKIYWEGNTPKWKLTPHTPKAYFFNCSPVKFDPNADPTMCDRLLSALDPTPRTVLLRNLSGIFDMDKIRELHGRILRAGFAVGGGANGKDTLRDIVSLIFPKQVVSVPLTKFIEYDKGDNKALKKLQYCRINWSTENNKETPLDKIQSLNVLVSGERNVFEVEEKFIASETMEEPPKAAYIFNCNNPPIIKSGLKSIRSRIVVYKFDKTFDHDPDVNAGELKADSRFKYDQKFQIEQVAPAFLNRMLEEFRNLALEGIDYKPLEAGFSELQEGSTHLWSFVNEVGLVANKDGRVWISELWERLEDWYIENGTLVKQELHDGSYKKIWEEQPIRFDDNVKGSNQVFKRFQKLFPQIKKPRQLTDFFVDGKNWKGKYYISGISFDTASLLHSPCNTDVSASPIASPTFTNSTTSSLFSSEGNSEEDRGAESLAVRSSEAVKQFTESPVTVLEIPEKQKNAGFKFGVDTVLQQKSSNRYVIVKKLPSLGFRFKAKSYLCEWLEPLSSDPDTTEWISQSDLKEVK